MLQDELLAWIGVFWTLNILESDNGILTPEFPFFQLLDPEHHIYNLLSTSGVSLEQSDFWSVLFCF